MDPGIAVVAVLVMLVGLVGVFVPVMPGLLLVWLAGVGSLLWTDRDTVAWVAAVLLTLFFVAGSLATVWLPTRRGRRGGVPLSSLAAAVLGAVVGFFVIPVAGFLVGAFAGLLIGEQRRLGDWQPAMRSVGGIVRAYGIGVLVEMVLGVAMIAVWAIAAFVG